MATLLADFDTAHCGAIHDSQLDVHGLRLATASADGHVRIWDVSEPRKPGFLCDLGGHAGAVYQVAWSPPEAGQLLASVGSDGCVIVWGPRHGDHGASHEELLAAAGESCPWRALRRECLRQHGPIHAVAWSPAEHGATLACACADGSVTVLTHHAGVLRTPEAGATVEHRWHAQSFEAHPGGSVHGLAWASSPSAGESVADGSTPGSTLAGARLATAGAGGLRVWRWDVQAGDVWTQEPLRAPRASSAAVVARDVAWRPWDGLVETLALADGQDVVVWQKHAGDAKDEGGWTVAHRIHIGEEVWRLSWFELGGVLLASCGSDAERHGVLLKQRLSGDWDVMDVCEEEEEPESAALPALCVGGAGGA